MNPALYLAQRLSAVVLAFAVTVHIVTIIYAVHSGLTAGAILARTQGSVPVFLFYAMFAVAAAVHAPIGLRAVLREWTPWRGRALDVALYLVAAAIALLGLRAAFAVYAA